MKIKVYTVLISCLLASACSEDFLDLPPVSNVSTDNFYKTESDFRNAVNAAYSALQEDDLYGDRLSHLTEVPSDNVGVESPGGAGGVSQNEIDVFVTSTTNPSVSAVYSASYEGIQRCNIVLARIEPVALTETIKNQFIGEVKFIRALLYFNLARLYGEVPLVITEISNAREGYTYERAPVVQVYRQITEDLLDAEQKLPLSYTGSNIGRVTGGAAKALLGKVYLTQKDFPAAVSKLAEVINQRIYALAPSYADNFDPAKSNNVGHRESIFEIQYKTGGVGEGSPWNNRTPPPGAPRSITGIGNANGAFMWPTADIAKAYREGDLRLTANLASVQVAGISQNYVKKYLHSAYGTVPFDQFDGDHNWPVLRYADVLLMYAEALNEVHNGPTPEAYAAVNQVRRRAFGVAVNTPSVTLDLAPGLSKADFFLAVEEERRLELAFEGHRWLDLIRTDRALPVMRAKGFDMQPHHVLFPIPQSEIDINPGRMTQNPGYL